MKKDQIIIRVGTEMKDQLQNLANKKGISLSEFTRSVLENKLRKGEKSIFEERLINLESNSLEGKWRNYLPKFEMTMAQIISIETGKSIDKVLIKLHDLLDDIAPREMQLELVRMRRADRENNIREIISQITKVFELSDFTPLVLESMILASFGFLYNDAIIQSYPLSLEFIKRINRIKILVND